MKQLFLTFFKIGLFTIGGGYAMIPLIESEVVSRHRWLSQQDFVDLLAVAQSTPGVFAVNMAVFIGHKLHRLRGSIAAASGAVLPSFLIILGIALFFQQLGSNPVVENIFRGIRPAVVALIAVPVFNVARSAGITWRTVWIPILCAWLIWQCGISPVWVIVCAGVAGFLYGRFRGE